VKSGDDLLITRLDPGVPLPVRAHPGDAGLDLCSSEDVTLKPGERASVGTGLAMAIPEGRAGFVLPRSGLAAEHGLSVVNAPGLIDAGYRGEVRVLLINLDPSEPIHIARGDRIAQLVIQPVETPVIRESDALPGSARGEGGFGSTGR
jgi:dUTP pyrophosphatase